MIIITGGGFIGSHLYNYLRFIHKIDDVKIVGKEFFRDFKRLNEQLSGVKIIIHLAGVNRNQQESFIYNENRKICSTLINALQESELFPRFINISSIHENYNSAFGRSKRENRIDFERYYSKQPDKLISFITPNIFGPFCRPHYNSFVATFCSQLTKSESVDLRDDKKIDLLYVDDLIKLIYSHMFIESSGVLNHFNTTRIMISEVLVKLKSYVKLYLDKGVMPFLIDDFDKNLFNTFRSYIPIQFFPKSQIKHTDNRGFFSEIIRSYSEGQVSISASMPYVERGNHFHTRKIERFQILKGKAIVELRKVDSLEIFSIELSANRLDYIDIPIWYTHNLINKSDDELIMLFWISEHYSEINHDTYMLNVRL